MSIRLITEVSIEDWNSYLKSSLTSLIKALKGELPTLAHLITPQLCIDTVSCFYDRMMLKLSFKSQQQTRFAPVLTRFMFFDTEKDGSLQLILAEIFAFYHQYQKTAMKIDDLSDEEFIKLYLSIYSLLEQKNIISIPSFCFIDIDEPQVQELTKNILHLRGEIVEFPEDASFIIKPSTSFFPQISEDFISLKQGKQIQFVDVLRTNKYFLRLVEKPDDRKNALVHARCTPAEFDFVMNIKDFLAVRQRQINNNTRELDDFMDDIYWQNIQQQAIILPPHFISDSFFFNLFLDPYDYLTSVQEAEIDRIQAKFMKTKKSEEFNINTTQSTIQKAVHAWQCKLRQAENKPANRHQISRNLIRGFESYNQEGGILNTSELMGGDKEKLIKIQQFKLENVPIQQIIQHQQFIDQSGELHSHLAVLGSGGTYLAGHPFTGKQQGVYRDFTKKGKKDENIISFNIKYFSKLDFNIICNVNEAIAILNNEPMPFELLAEESLPESQNFCYGENKFAKQLAEDVYLQPAVQAEKYAQIQRIPDWFSANNVSQFEREFFPPNDFDPQTYLQNRNLLIASYRSLPHIFLRFSPCLEFMDFDYAKNRKIYDFLTSHHLINDKNLTLKQTIPAQKYLKNAPNFTFSCGFCGQKLTEFCYFFAQTQQPAEHQPQILCEICYHSNKQIQGKYLHLRPFQVDLHSKFVIVDAFRRTCHLGWLAAVRIASEAGKVSQNAVLRIVAEYGFGERNSVEQRDLGVGIWENEVKQGFLKKGNYVQKGREGVVVNSLVSGKREFCKGLQELESYLVLLEGLVGEVK